jgi:hypothetical protein
MVLASGSLLASLPVAARGFSDSHHRQVPLRAYSLPAYFKSFARFVAVVMRFSPSPPVRRSGCAPFGLDRSASGRGGRSKKRHALAGAWNRPFSSDFSRTSVARLVMSASFVKRLL